LCVLGSEEKKVEDLNGFGDGLKVEKHNERFDDQLHGRMSARADMEDERVRKNMEEDTRHYWSSSESTSRRAMDRLLLIPVRSSRAVRLLWPLLTAATSHALGSGAKFLVIKEINMVQRQESSGCYALRCLQYNAGLLKAQAPRGLSILA
jgi:hypothetical protein